MCLLVGVEALVGWLLDHADVQVTDLSDADTGSEECSDEEVVEDVDDSAYAVVSASCVVAPPFCQPDLCSGFPACCSMGPLCSFATHIMKLPSADWVFCALITSALNQPLVPTSNDVG